MIGHRIAAWGALAAALTLAACSDQKSAEQKAEAPALLLDGNVLVEPLGEPGVVGLRCCAACRRLALAWIVVGLFAHRDLRAFRGGGRFRGRGAPGGRPWGGRRHWRGRRFYGAPRYYGGPVYGYGPYRRCWINRWGYRVCRRPVAPIVPFPFPFLW